MADYFYLMSSLPMLKAESEMPISYAQFLSYCSGNVKSSVYEQLSTLTLEADAGPLTGSWSEFYRGYKAELTYQRKKKLGMSNAGNTDKDSDTAKLIASALADSNPLNAELTLLTLQFNKLDSLIGMHAFDDYALFGYALKLKLLERKTIFDQQRGKRELNSLVVVLEEHIERMS